ncbi:hypothetical protein D3C80_1463150 [compost metagenome]
MPLARASTPAATLVATSRWTITRMASLRVASTLKRRRLLAPVCKVPQAVSRRPAASSPLRFAPNLASASADGPTPLQVPNCPAASSADISATRCSFRCSRYSLPLSTTINRNSSPMPRVKAAISPIAPRCRAGKREDTSTPLLPMATQGNSCKKCRQDNGQSPSRRPAMAGISVAGSWPALWPRCCGSPCCALPGLAGSCS